MIVLKLSRKNFEEILKITIQSIKEGKVIICPTDTVYGLICDATNKKAVGKLFKIKKRPKEKPIPIFVKDIRTAKNLAYINKSQEKFLKKVWPGEMTTVFKRKNELPKILFGKAKTIGFRIPKYKLVNELLKELDYPLAETSANISGGPAPTEIKEVLEQFKSQKYQPDLVIDAGNLLKSKPSIVLDLTIWPPKILRL
jgi:L-threonylcarbamoyladenylate synthase